jgi:hypothetical protein
MCDTFVLLPEFTDDKKFILRKTLIEIRIRHMKLLLFLNRRIQRMKN